MTKRSILYTFLGIALLLTGCVTYPNTVSDIMAVGYSDLLSAAKDNGIVKEFAMNFDETFDYMLEKLKDNDLTIYQEHRSGSFIIAMGFPKQNETTRVGIFLTSGAGSSTKVTISSLSSGCLLRAEKILFT
jgi:hypothetical protein